MPQRIDEYAQEVAEDIIESDKVVIAPKVTRTLLLLGTRNEGIGSVHPPHNSYFTIDENDRSHHSRGIGTSLSL